MNQNSKPHMSLEKFLVSVVCEPGSWLERLVHVLGFPEVAGVRM